MRAIRGECQMLAKISPLMYSSSFKFVTASFPAYTSRVRVILKEAGIDELQFV